MRHAFGLRMSAGVLGVALAAGARAQCTPAPTRLCVTVGPKTSSNPNPGGVTECYYINGVESPVVALTRGITYDFQMVGVSFAHPFYLCDNPEGNGSGEYTLGVSPPGGVSGTDTLSFAVPAAAPSLLYYGCTHHARMGWRISISNPPCYANCDGSTVAPVLNVLDFSCFLNRFAAGDPYANCDQSTTPPVLNVLDFSCFLNRFAAGCS